MIDYIDEIEITVESGAGEVVYLHSEREVRAFGGPDGGNGGEGGSVYFKGNSNLNSEDLIQIDFTKQIRVKMVEAQIKMKMGI